MSVQFLHTCNEVTKPAISGTKVQCSHELENMVANNFSQIQLNWCVQLHKKTFFDVSHFPCGRLCKCVCFMSHEWKETIFGQFEGMWFLCSLFSYFCGKSGILCLLSTSPSPLSLEHTLFSEVCRNILIAHVSDIAYKTKGEGGGGGLGAE